MPTIKLTKTSVERLEYQGKQEQYFDDKMTGWGVRVNASSKTYFVQCRVKGHVNAKGRPLEIKETIGRTDHIKFERAHERAKSILEDASEGISPQDRHNERETAGETARIAATAEERKNVTVQEVMDAYFLTKKKLKKSTMEFYSNDFTRYIPDWLNLPIRSIDADMIVERHSLIGVKSKARADGVMRVMRALFNFAMTMYEDVVFKNPVKKLSSLGAWYRVGRKESYIAPSQLKAWFSAVLNLNYDTSRDFILLMLFNGPRAEIEAASLKWKDINFVDRTCKFRETKNGEPLYVPLSDYIMKIMKTRQKYYDTGPESYVFPSYGKSGHIVTARVSLKAIQRESGLLVTHHDLRRSFLSYCEALDVPIFTQKRLVGHALPQDVTQGYIQFSMDKLRYEIERIAEFILANAGMGQQKPETILSDGQMEKLKGTDFWESLDETQQLKFVMAMNPDDQGSKNGKIVDLNEIRTRRRMSIKG